MPVLIGEKLTCLQFIPPTGKPKKFLYEGEVTGGFYFVNDAAHDLSTILLCESFTNAATLYEATNIPAVVASGAGNLTTVAASLRASYPQSKIIVCGDHDKSGTGQKAAKEAAAAVNGIAVIPEVEGDDWNDVHVRLGLEAVKKAVTETDERHHAG